MLEYIKGLLKSSIETREDYLIVKSIRQSAYETYGVELTPEEVVKALYGITLEKSKQREEEEIFQKSLQSIADAVYEEYGVELTTEEVYKSLVIKAILTGVDSKDGKKLEQFRSDTPQEHKKHGPHFVRATDKDATVSRSTGAKGKLTRKVEETGMLPEGKITSSTRETNVHGEDVYNKTNKPQEMTAKKRPLTKEEESDLKSSPRGESLKNKLVLEDKKGGRGVVEPKKSGGTLFQRIAHEIGGKGPDGRKGVKHEGGYSHGGSEVSAKDLPTKQTAAAIESATGKQIGRGKKKLVEASGKALERGAISRRTHDRLAETVDRAKEKEQGVRQKGAEGRDIRIQGQTEKPEEGKVSATMGADEPTEKRQDFSKPKAQEARSETRQTKEEKAKEEAAKKKREEEAANRKSDEENPYGETPEQIAKEKRREDQ